jgi:hypothetical protein
MSLRPPVRGQIACAERRHEPRRARQGVPASRRSAGRSASPRGRRARRRPRASRHSWCSRRVLSDAGAVRAVAAPIARAMPRACRGRHSARRSGGNRSGTVVAAAKEAGRAPGRGATPHGHGRCSGLGSMRHERDFAFLPAVAIWKVTRACDPCRQGRGRQAGGEGRTARRRRHQAQPRLAGAPSPGSEVDGSRFEDAEAQIDRRGAEGSRRPAARPQVTSASRSVGQRTADATVGGRPRR